MLSRNPISSSKLIGGDWLLAVGCWLLAVLFKEIKNLGTGSRRSRNWTFERSRGLSHPIFAARNQTKSRIRSFGAFNLESRGIHHPAR